MSVSRIGLVVLLAGLFGATAGVAVMSYLQPERPQSTRVAEDLPVVKDFALLDHQGNHHQLYRYRNASAVVLYIHGVGCPIVRNSINTLQTLARTFADRGVEFLLINANPQDGGAALVEEAALLGIELPILKDPSQLVIQDLGVARTGEAIVVDPSTWTIRYRGPLDDRLDYEAQRPKASEHYLADALEAVLDGETVAPAKVPGVGCAINTEDNMAYTGRDISYTEEVAPILLQKCVACHSEGGIGPWAMDSHATVKGWGTMIREVVLNRRMPPWHADPSIGKFAQDPSLDLNQQRTLVHWIDAGAPRGEGEDPLTSMPTLSHQDWPMGEPDLVIDVPEQRLPAQGLIPYRWVKLAVPIERDRWVRAVDLRPSNQAAIHHGFVFVEYPERLKDQQPAWLEGRNGFFCAYVPGLEVQPFPEGAGQLLPAGSTLVFQLHYVSGGYATADRPRLGLYFHDRPPAREYLMLGAANMRIRIPPHAADHQELAAASFEEDVLLHGFYPHMHYRGSRFKYQAHYPDGAQETLLSVPRYDINWQRFYRLLEPKTMPAGTRIEVTAGFDNSAQNPLNPDPSKEVRWGLKSIDEMLVGYLMYTRERPTDAVRL